MLVKLNQIYKLFSQQQQQHHDKQLFICRGGQPDEIFGAGHLHPHIRLWSYSQCCSAVCVLRHSAKMDGVNYLHDQLGSDGLAPPLPPSLQNARQQSPLASLPPSSLFSVGKPVFCRDIWQHLHHHVYSCGPMGGYLSPVQSQTAAFPQSSPGDLRGGLVAGAGGDLSDHLSLQGGRADEVPLLPQFFRERLEPCGDSLSAGVWVPGACAGGGLRFGPDHLGSSAVRPEQPTEPGLREDHLQQSECLPVAFHPQPPGHLPAVPGEINCKLILSKLNFKVKRQMKVKI